MTEVDVGYMKNVFLWNVDGCDVSGCKTNKAISDRLIEKEHIHNASDERYSDSQRIYQSLILDTINLGAGLVVSIAFILFNYKGAPKT